MRIRVNSANAMKILKNAGAYTEGYGAGLDQNKEILMQKIGIHS